MGRTVFVDETINDYVSNLFSNGQWQLGLIIGQNTQQKDFAVRLVRSPEPAEDEASEDDESPKETKPPQRPDSMADCDEKWIATHAKQVTRMLPGGFEVIGIFALAPPNMMQATQAKFRQILFLINKVLSRGQTQRDSNPDRYLLQICSSTRKYTCRTIDIMDQKSAFRPADWKVQSGNERWIRLQTEFSINLPINVSTKQQNLSMLKQIQHGLVPYCENIQSGLITINKEFRDSDELLDQSETKKSKGRDKGQTTQQVYEIEFFSSPMSTNKTEAIVTDCVVCMHIDGQIKGRAFVHSKATVSEARQAIITDIIRSIHSRCELLCEDIEVVEDEAIKKELYDAPVRVFGKLPGSSIDFCDYKFQDEKPEEVMERIKELLDLDVEPESLELDCEEVPCMSNLETSLGGTLPEDGGETGETQAKKSSFNLTTLIAGGIAVIAAGLSYLSLTENPNT